MHAAGGAPHLVRQRRGGHRRRTGVGHLEYRRDAAHHGGERAGGEILLVLGARLAEMDLAVDDAGEDMEAGAIDDLAGRRRVDAADGGDPAVARRDVANSGTVLVDDRAVPEDDVEGLGQGGLRGPGLARPAGSAYVTEPRDASREERDASPEAYDRGSRAYRRAFPARGCRASAAPTRENFSTT